MCDCVTDPTQGSSPCLVARCWKGPGFRAFSSLNRSLRRLSSPSTGGGGGLKLREMCAAELDEDEVFLLLGEADGLLQHRASLLGLVCEAEYFREVGPKPPARVDVVGAIDDRNCLARECLPSFEISSMG